MQQQLRAAGFQVTAGVAGIPTAFVATFGSGQPVIGIVGEYDALPNLSQENSPVQRQIVPQGPGHGCGHNLLGTACKSPTAVGDGGGHPLPCRQICQRRRELRVVPGGDVGRG